MTNRRSAAASVSQPVCVEGFPHSENTGSGSTPYRQGNGVQILDLSPINKGSPGAHRIITGIYASASKQRSDTQTDEELRRGLEVSWKNQGRPLRIASGS